MLRQPGSVHQPRHKQNTTEHVNDWLATDANFDGEVTWPVCGTAVLAQHCTSERDPATPFQLSRTSLGNPDPELSINVHHQCALIKQQYGASGLNQGLWRYTRTTLDPEPGPNGRASARAALRHSVGDADHTRHGLCAKTMAALALMDGTVMCAGHLNHIHRNSSCAVQRQGRRECPTALVWMHLWQSSSVLHALAEQPEVHCRAGHHKDVAHAEATAVRA